MIYPSSSGGGAPSGSAGGVLTGTYPNPTLSVIANGIVDSYINGATTVSWLLHDPTITGTIGSASGNIGGVKLGHTYVASRWTNGPGGEVNYIDDVWKFGPNVGTSSGKIDATKANLGLTFESRYYQSSVFASEFHLEGISTDGLTAYRPMSFFVAHDASIIGQSLTGDYINIADKAGTQMVKFDFQSGTKTISINQSTTMGFSVNNVPTLTQRNAANDAFLNLPYIDSTNTLVIAQSFNAAGARASSVFATLQPATANSNDTILHLQGATVSGTHKGIVARTTASTLFQTELNNQGAGVSELLMQVEGAGDPRIKFDDLTGRFVMGIDNSASHVFKISTGSALGTGDVFTMTSAGNVLLAGTLTVTGAVATPVSAGAAGVAGQFSFDASFFYACVATNTWVRGTLASW